jgi:hypothetical protein
MSLDKRKRIGYVSSLRQEVLMASKQRSRQDSGFGIQAQLWEHASRYGKHREVAVFAQTKGRALYEKEKDDFSKLEERGGNVYENKGPAFSSLRRSGDVTENKGSYALRAGMLLKRRVVKR